MDALTSACGARNGNGGPPTTWPSSINLYDYSRLREPLCCRRILHAISGEDALARTILRIRCSVAEQLNERRRSAELRTVSE